MNGYIDLHTHLLPGLDDGSESLDETLEIVRYGVEAGFGHFVCTPHIIRGAYDNTYETIYDGTVKLQSALDEEGIDAHVFPAAENFLDDFFFEVVEEGKPIAIRPWTSDVLVETPFLRIPKYFDEITFRMQMKRIRPILAHPERYEEFIRKPKRVVRMIEAGYRIQVNLGSFGEMYGRDVRKAAEKMIKIGAVDFVGSDVHSAEQAEFLYGECVARLRKVAGADLAERLLRTNAEALLSAPRPNPPRSS